MKTSEPHIRPQVIKPLGSPVPTAIPTDQSETGSKPTGTTNRDETTTRSVRQEGSFAPTAEQLGAHQGSALAQTLIEQKDAGEAKRRGRGRTGDLRRLQTPRQTLVAQSRKPGVRTEHKRLLDLGQQIQRLLAQFEG